MNKFALAAAAGMVFVATVTLAADRPPTPQSFAYGLELAISGSNPFHELELPLEVYQNVTRTDLGDIRVFNGNDDIVPHLLRKPTRKFNRDGAISTSLQSTTGVPTFRAHRSPSLIPTAKNATGPSKSPEMKTCQFFPRLSNSAGNRIDWFFWPRARPLSAWPMGIMALNPQTFRLRISSADIRPIPEPPSPRI